MHRHFYLFQVFMETDICHREQDLQTFITISRHARTAGKLATETSRDPAANNGEAFGVCNLLGHTMSALIIINLWKEFSVDCSHK